MIINTGGYRPSEEELEEMQDFADAEAEHDPTYR